MSSARNGTKAEYSTLRLTCADVAYDVEVQICPPRHPAHVGPDSPKYMDPGAPLRVRVIRILHERADVGAELTPYARAAVESLVELEMAVKYGQKGARVETAEVVVTRGSGQMELGL